MKSERTYGRIRQHSVRSVRPYRRVTLKIRREKKRGHTHKMYETVNTKRQTVYRCSICKHHSFSLFINLYYNFLYFLLMANNSDKWIGIITSVAMTAVFGGFAALMHFSPQ